jgi:SOS-response transcriptional repressor LexA
MPKAENKEIAKRLRSWVDANFPSVAEFARRTKKPSQFWYQYFNASRKPGNEAQALLRSVGCPIEQIITGVKKENEPFETIPLMKIPVYQYVKAGGTAMVLKETPSEYIFTIKSNDASLFAVVVKGNSMFPEIKEGDIVVVSKNQEPRNGDTCIVVFEDEQTCLRKVYQHNHQIMLTSINESEYPPASYKKYEIKSIYRVVQRITNYR